MNLHLLKKVMLCAAMLTQVTFCFAQDSEEELNLKYWTMRERFRRYFVSIGKNSGQGIPVSKKQANLYGGARCGNMYSTSAGTMSWGDATSYIGDYMCTLATEYALLTQEGKDTKATLSELYYALNAIDRLDGFAEFTFDNNKPINDYNGFFLRDDVQQSTLSFWNNQYSNVNIGGPNSIGSSDPGLNYKCFNSDRDTNFDNEATGNSGTNEPSFDQISNLLTGFSFIKKYVPNVYVKPRTTDVGFNIIDKMQAITVNIMDYMSGADRQLQQADHASEFFFNYIAHPTPGIFGPGTPLSFTLNSSLNYLITDADCGNNDIRGNWILVNPVTGRKVGITSSDTKGQDIRLFSYAFAKVAENLTGDNQYLGRDIHHEAVDHLGDNYNCLTKHDYHIPLSVVSIAWSALASMTTVPEDLVFTIGPITSAVFSKPLGIKVSSLPRNFYIFESLGATSGTWSHTNVNKFANFYGHENMDLVYSCLNDETPLNSKQHYINLLSKLSCQGPHRNSTSDYTSFWNHPNNFEQPNPNDIIDINDSYEFGEYNANDWMWLYNMYRLKFGDSSFPSYNDKSCNCKTNPVIEQFYDLNTTMLTSSIYLNRVFLDYLKIGISMKEYLTKNLIINNKILENRTEFIICNSSLTVTNNGILRNPNYFPASDSIKIVVRSGSKILIQNNGLLEVGNNSKVIIQNGGELKCSAINSKIIVRSGSKLIIESGALLELNSASKLIVENGGQVIINPGGKFDLNTGAKLIVEDGGQVIIQTNLSNPSANDNAVLTYNQGAEIQLKGDNAVLELNGKLHIGDNATFSITYPGSNSGYIKFNRGVGVWWDNWAPNNAHISCGTNARINLQGKSKTDKMIEINQINVAIPKNLTQFVMTKSLVEFRDVDARLETDRPTIITNSTFQGWGGNYAGRGLTVYGQPICLITNCDFSHLGWGVIGALFYSGTKLSGVKNCNFSNCISGIVTIGGGINVTNNTFLNVGSSIASLDATANSFIFNNNISTNHNNQTAYYSSGLALQGANVEFDIKQNTINNTDYGLTLSNANVKLRCNDLQNNALAMLAADNSFVNMSDVLGAGYNNANNCEKFAWFLEAGTFEANNGFNNFKINNSVPCTWIDQSGHVPNIIPGHWDCPTITEGSLINFINFNLTDNKYEIIAENNFWRPLVSPTDVIEDKQNNIRKIDLTDINYPIIDSASLLTGIVLTSVTQANCPASGGGCVGLGCRTNNQIHPLDDNSNSTTITTASFYNKKLQKALQFSLNKMDKMQNDIKVNQAAELLTECLKYNYVTPVVNSVDKYLLELAYQKLYTCVVQLTEWHRDSVNSFNPIPQSLQNRFNDLHTICALRAGRKSITEKDYKEISDLILLDKALAYRVADDRVNALSIVNSIISSAPKASHLKMYQKFSCTWQTEIEAINGSITLDEALAQFKSCNNNYSHIQNTSTSNSRMMLPKEESSIVYATDYAIAVYPNPTNGNLSVAYNLIDFKDIVLEINDTQGKLMNSVKLNPSEKTINIDDLNLGSGVYFYKIIGDGKTLMAKKLVVIK